MSSQNRQTHGPPDNNVISQQSPNSGRSTARFLSKKFIWPGIKKDAREWAKTCINCQTSKICCHTESVIDRGPAFLSEIWLALANLMGTTLHSNTAYNPAGNGMVEHTHRTLKASLIASCTDGDWKSRLSWVVLGLRTTPCADGETSPAEKVYGEALAVPSEFFPTYTDDMQLDHLKDITRKFRPCLKTYQDRTNHYKPRNLDDCEYIYVCVDAHRHPLTRPYRGPYQVIMKTTKAFLLDVHGQEDWVSIDCVKLVFLEGCDTASAGPGRSRVPPQE
ncbi:uncharacterized protein [Palaemon carinicauda]|uniref:uncharacterized protein n=1 Tax=Palaemon carinicauda TaxID=392227 RepID=UPI0035B5A6E6